MATNEILKTILVKRNHVPDKTYCIAMHLCRFDNKACKPYKKTESVASLPYGILEALGQGTYYCNEL